MTADPVSPVGTLPKTSRDRHAAPLTRCPAGRSHTLRHPRNSVTGLPIYDKAPNKRALLVEIPGFCVGSQAF
jgi:hypothetical protein